AEGASPRLELAEEDRLQAAERELAVPKRDRQRRRGERGAHVRPRVAVGLLLRVLPVPLLVAIRSSAASMSRVTARPPSAWTTTPAVVCGTNRTTALPCS